MKNIILSTVGSAGDVLPMLGLGRGLIDRGHDVTMIYNPYFQSEIESAGIKFIPIGSIEEFAKIMESPDLWHPVRGFQIIAEQGILRFMEPLYKALEHFEPEDTLLIGSGFSFGMRLAQETRGFKLITVHLQSSLFMSPYENSEMGGFRLPEWMPLGFRRGYYEFIERATIDRFLAPAVNNFRKELGLPPVDHIFSEWSHSPDQVLGLFPDWFAPPQPDWPPNVLPMGFIKYETGDQSLSPELKSFLEEGEPPIVFTPGSAMKHGRGFFEAAVEASRQLHMRAILLTRFQEHIPESLPAGVIHARWVPMSTLLPHTALLVHHGGIGTTAQALAAGIPQLIMPLAHDQFDNANRIRRLGVGDRLDPKKFNTRNLVPKLTNLLHEAGVQEQCKSYAARVDFDRAMADTCDLIEHFE